MKNLKYQRINNSNVRNVTTNAKKEVTLKKHINTRHEDQQCKLCSKNLASTIELLQHMAKEHSIKVETNENNTKDKEEETLSVKMTIEEGGKIKKDTVFVFGESM